MIKNIKKIYVFIIIFSSIILYNSIVNAASFSASASKTTLEPGKSATITITAKDCAGRFDITSSNSSVVSVNKSNTWVENGSSSITINSKKEGTATITVKATDVSSTDAKEITGSKKISIKVKNATTNNNAQNDSKPSNQTQTNNENSKKEPVFTTTNKIATVTAKVNFRSSYSTESSSLGTLKEGENVTIVGTGNNGWSKVKYNGKTGYIKTEYLSVSENGTESEEQDDEKVVFGLDTLKVKGYELSPEFNTEIYEYTINPEEEIKELDIEQAVSNSETAKVEITGNGNFKVGENIVKISVTDEENNNSAIYQIKVNIPEKTESQQTVPDQTVFNEEIDKIQNDLNIKMWAIRGIIIFVTIAIIIMFILRYRTVKSENVEKEYSKKDGYVIIDKKFDTEDGNKEKIAKIEQFDEEIEKNKQKDVEPPVQPKRMKKNKGKHF